MPAFARALAAEHPEEIALRDARQALDWASLGDILDRVANLTLGADLGPKRRVAVFAENAVETAIAHLGALLGSSSTVPVNFHLTADEARYIVTDSESRIVFVGPETFDRAVEVLTALGGRAAGAPVLVAWRCEERLAAARAAGIDCTDWSAWVASGAAGDPPLDVPPRPNLLYTSGTTGLPKGTELPPTMFAGGGTMAEHLEALKLAGSPTRGVNLVVGPMYHTGPLSGMRILVAGIPSVILDRFDAQKTLQTIHEHRVETTVMVPTHFVRLLALPDEVKARYDVSSLKTVRHTGAKCPVDVKRSMIGWWGPVFFDAYGATEVGVTCGITSEEWLEHPGSVGRSVPPFTVLVLDDDDNEVAPGVEGRLFFRDSTGRGIIYPNDPAKTAAANIAPGVFTLGEIGYVDADGYVFITDRFSDMVVSGGANIYPAESEQVLIRHPEVLDVACIGVPNAEMGEELKALVILRDPSTPPTAEDIIGFCRANLSHYKCPRTVEFVTDIGRTTMGKVNKKALRAPYWEGHTD